MSNVDIKFEEMFVISTTALHINRSHYSIVRDAKWMLQFSLILMLSLTTFGFLLNSVVSYDLKSGNIAEASKNGTMVIVGLTITLKYFVLLYHQDSINELISTVNRDYDIAKTYCEEEKGIVLKYAKRGVTVSKYWLVFGFGTSSIFPIKAIVLMSYYHWKGEFVLVPMFDWTYPDKIEVYKNVTWIFVVLFALCVIFGLYASSMYVGFDPLVPIFMLHTCGQLELLTQRISKAFVDDVNETRENLKNIILKLQILYNFMDSVKSSYHIYYEYSMKATTCIVPLTMFQILEELRNARFNVEFVSLFVACILHFYMPCYYSDLLMEMEIGNCLHFSILTTNNTIGLYCGGLSENFRQSIYSCGWEKCPDKGVRQTVLFMMTRARSPMGISTVFCLINLDTFAEMCRQSYGILNLINASCA